MISIRNQQRKVAIDKESLLRDAKIVVHDLGYADFDLGIMFVTPEVIHEYNRDYRGKDKPTDILSFAFHPDVKAGEKIIAHTEDDRNLGDLIICPEYVLAQLPELETTWEARLRVLLVHGICHLRGYDHEIDEDYEIMHKEETRLLKLLDAGQ